MTAMGYNVLDKDYLRRQIETYVRFGEKRGFPSSLGEFGLSAARSRTPPAAGSSGFPT